jgi:Na+-transporting methylmalonyl-CoA/oxaloacetate decarboxylase gamma subunit
VGEDGKAVLMAVSDMVGFTFVLLYLFLVVMTVKLLSSAVSSSLGD